MSDRRITFVDLCLDGQVDPSAIDDFIDEWHASDAACTVEQYLGFTREEYAYWIEQPWALRFILFSRRAGMPLGKGLQWGSGQNIAARGTTLEEAQALEAWLKRTRKTVA